MVNLITEPYPFFKNIFLLSEKTFNANTLLEDFQVTEFKLEY